MAGTLAIKVARLAVVVAFFAAWEVLSRTGTVNPRLLPSASDTLATLWELLNRPSVRNDLLGTASEVLSAFILAVPCGAVIGFLIAENRYFAEVAKPWKRRRNVERLRGSPDLPSRRPAPGTAASACRS